MSETAGGGKILALALTNLPVLAPALWAFRNKLVLEGFVFANVALASSLYHFCDENWPYSCSQESFRVLKAFDESVARTAAVTGAALLGGLPHKIRTICIVSSLIGCACLQASTYGSDSSLVLTVVLALASGLGGLAYAVVRALV